MKKGKLKDIRSFVVFYAHLKKVPGADLLILEPKGVPPEALFALKYRGKTVLSYFSVVETGPHEPEFSHFAKEDFLSVDGRIVKNEEYGNFCLDLSMPSVQEVLQEKAERLLLDYHGLFLDTLGNLDFWNLPEEVKKAQIIQAAKLLKAIKAKHPEGILVQNNGVIRVCDHTYPYLDGICFENPPGKTRENRQFTRSVFKKLRKLENRQGIRILILEETSKKQDFKDKILQILFRCYLNCKGWLYYRGSRYYL